MVISNTTSLASPDLVKGPYTLLPDGRIDCTFTHPEWGDVPYTADANDSWLICREIHAIASVKMKAEQKEEPQ